MNTHRWYAGSVLTKDLLIAFRNGKQLTVGMENLQQNSINLTFSLSGFSAAFDRIMH